MAPSKAKSRATKSGARPRKPRTQTQLQLPTTSETIVTLDQSLDLLRIAVVAAISQITWARGVFSNDCYEVRFVDANDHNTSYEDFLQGTTAWHEGKHWCWRLLARGSDTKVDKVLNWLETGVKEAMEKKYLASLQFSFYEGKVVCPEALVEAYTLTFTYIDGEASVQLNAKARTGSNSEGKTMMLYEVKEGMRRLMESNLSIALMMHEQLPNLPEDRVVDMHLTYTDICPKGWNAAGFKSCIDPRLVIAIPEKARVNYANVGHHKIQVDVFNKYTTPQSSLTDANNAARSGHDEIATDPTAAQTSQTPANIALPRRRQISQLSQLDSIHTQELAVVSFDSIGASRDAFAQTQDTQSLQEQADTVAQNEKGAWVPYSQSVLSKIREARDEKERSYTPIQNDDDEIQGNSPHIVTCECGSSTDEHNLIQCSLCSKLQHMECYGYLESVVPDELLANFICYTCLLINEKPLLLEMYRLCVKRRALWFLREKGELKDPADLAQYLNRERRVTSKLLDQLQADGLIKSVKNTKGTRKVKGCDNGSHYIFVKSSVKLRRDYFNPQLNIAHHFEIPEDSPLESTLAERSQGALAPTSISDLAGLQNHTLPSSSHPATSSTEGSPSPPAPNRTFGNAQTPKSGPSDLRRSLAMKNKRLAEMGTGEEKASKRQEMSSTYSPLK